MIIELLTDQTRRFWSDFITYKMLVVSNKCNVWGRVKICGLYSIVIVFHYARTKKNKITMIKHAVTAHAACRFIWQLSVSFSMSDSMVYRVRSACQQLVSWDFFLWFWVFNDEKNTKTPDFETIINIVKIHKISMTIDKFPSNCSLFIKCSSKQ